MSLTIYHFMVSLCCIRGDQNQGVDKNWQNQTTFEPYKLSSSNKKHYSWFLKDVPIRVTYKTSLGSLQFAYIFWIFCCFFAFLFLDIITSHIIPSFSKYVWEIFRKTNILCPLIPARTCAYQGLRDVSFSENVSNVLNEWSLSHQIKMIQSQGSRVIQETYLKFTLMTPKQF